MAFGSYPTDADGTVRPIVWRVLKNENGEAYLLSEYILFSAPVHGDYEHYSGWAASDLYNYLNGVFLNDAFSAEEQSVLLQRTEDGALVTLITSDEMKDASIGFSSNKACFVISDQWQRISDRVMRDMDRGVTQLTARGAYTGTERPTLLCVIGRSEIMAFKRILREEDENAFVIIVEAHEAIGDGFSGMDK